MTWDEVTGLLHGADWKGMKAGLTRIRELLSLLGNPERGLRFVHIAGTNGKGSAAAMLSCVLTLAGYRTGRYISPHLMSMNERFSVDGEEISDDFLIELAGRVRLAAEQMDEKPSNFELLTAISFLYFAASRCDVVVLEVGLGGRLDATNVIETPLVSLIMNIGLEHTKELGDTLAQIAFEKGGIIKQDGDVVLYHQSEDVMRTIGEICKERKASLTVTKPSLLTLTDQGTLDDDTGKAPLQVFSYRERHDVRLSLLGAHQIRNAAVVLDTISLLTGRHGFHIPEEAVRKGLSLVKWPGRFQVLSRHPLFLLDGAHNPNGTQALADCVRQYLSGRRLILLMGVMADKDYGEMLDIMASVCMDPDNRITVSRFLAQAPDESRALSTKELKRAIGERFPESMVEACESVQAGMERALALAREDAGTAVLAFGSLYQAGEILELSTSGIIDKENGNT